MLSTAPTLCESVLGVHSRKAPSFLFSSHPLSPWRRRRGLLCNSRFLGRWPRHVCRSEKLMEKSMEVSTSATRDNLFNYIWNKNSSKLLELNDGLYSSVVDEAAARTNQTSGACLSGAMKFLALLGFVTFQGSQQAIAGTDALSGMQVLSYLGDVGDISTGFTSAFLLIFFSELGDKTFFIAALLAAQNSGAVIFVGTFGALAAMTLVSVLLGRTFHYIDGILPFKFGTDLPVDDIAAVCLLVYFGVTTLIDATSDDPSKTADEKKEAELAISELSGNGAGMVAATNTVISTFLLVFVAEWGDKSFFSTIALAAAASPLGVIAGALAGHAVATTLAVVGGSLLGSFFSEKVISYIGGTLFLVFAAATIMEIIN